jgi:hypothetical protein
MQNGFARLRVAQFSDALPFRVTNHLASFFFPHLLYAACALQINAILIVGVSKRTSRHLLLDLSYL